MGPLLFAGLATFGSIVAIGIVAAGAPRRTGGGGPIPPSRRMAVIVFALATGSGLWGVMVALFAAASRANGAVASAGSLAGAPLVAVLPIVGAVIALALLMGAFSTVDPWILGRSALFIGALVVLTIVVAILTVVLHGPATTMDARPFLLLGGVSAGAAIVLGAVGVGAVRAVAELDGSAPADPAVRAAIERELKRCVPAFGAALAAAAFAIVLVASRV